MKPLFPGSEIGILGSGQLGRMTAQAALRMGYRVATFSPDRPPTPCAQAGAREVHGEYTDTEAVEAFARSVDVVTFEFENVSSEATSAAARWAPVRPAGSVLHATQHRIREKTFLSGAGVPTARFRAVTSEADLEDFPYPAILKTAGFGYDGKGQAAVADSGEARAAFRALGGAACILEERIDFAWEGSVVAARGIDGSFRAYPLVRNDHARHILDTTTAPAPEATPATRRDSEEIARTLLERLDVVGVLCIEFFVGPDGDLKVNELAPRPHNSGHWSIEGAETSQFEQQVRAVCGLPLGSTQLRAPGVAMANLLGDHWPTVGEPDWSGGLEIPGIHLHLYGKAEVRQGRKMGHLTALGRTPAEAVGAVRRARERIGRRPPVVF